jgi:hypothetical protein
MPIFPSGVLDRSHFSRNLSEDQKIATCDSSCRGLHFKELPQAAILSVYQTNPEITLHPACAAIACSLT